MLEAWLGIHGLGSGVAHTVLATLTIPSDRKAMLQTRGVTFLHSLFEGWSPPRFDSGRQLGNILGNP